MAERTVKEGIQRKKEIEQGFMEDNPSYNAIIKAINDRMEEIDYPIAALARASSLTRQVVKDILRSKSSPKLVTILMICDELGLDLLVEKKEENND